MLKDSRMSRRIAIEILLGRFDPGQMFRGVSAQDLFVPNRDGLAPIQLELALLPQALDRPADSRRAFRMADALVAGASFVGDDLHNSSALLRWGNRSESTEGGASGASPFQLRKSFRVPVGRKTSH